MSVKNFYVYNAFFDAVPVVAGGTASQNVVIDADADFELHRLAMFSAIGQLTESTELFIPVTIMITNQVNGRSLMSAPVLLGSIFGDGMRPFILDIPAYWRASSDILITIKNGTNIIWVDVCKLNLSFIGVKVFR
jgi:hypothetical protein